MKKLQIAIVVFCLFISSFLYANNGKVTCAYPVENIVIDGSFTDWSKQNWVFLKEGLPLKTNIEDFQAKFQVGYNEQENAVYFIVEISDNQFVSKNSEPWYLVDNLVLYFNPMHSERASSASMLILKRKLLKLHTTTVTVAQPSSLV